jgi:hypothetical protein
MTKPTDHSLAAARELLGANKGHDGSEPSCDACQRIARVALALDAARAESFEQAAKWCDEYAGELDNREIFACAPGTTANACAARIRQEAGKR